ncbi:F-box/FBD/LRR-repeat protein At5g53840 [Linum perenne]
MKKQPNESAAAGEDLISDLPDEILHSVLRRIPYFKEAAQTSALSSRWRNLWSSYPVVELDSATSPYYTSHSASPFYPLCRFYSTTSEGFYSFHNATMTKFSRDKLLRIETLKLSVCTYFPFPRSPAIEQLLDLASERKAENIEIKVDSDLFLCLPFGLLSNSSAKIIRLQRIGFLRDNSILISLNSLCSLHLSTVNFDDELLFANLIASSPLLETLELEHVYAPMSKLRLSNVSSLKVLMISSCHWVKEIEIVALALQTLHIQDMDQILP